MNVFIGSGKVIKAKLLDGERKMLKFTLAISGNNSNEGKERIDCVPCIIYNPADDIERMLSRERQVELQGRVKIFSFEIAGEKTYKTEIVVNQKSLKELG